MNHLFGKKKEPVKEPTATDAVTKLKEVRALLGPTIGCGACDCSDHPARAGQHVGSMQKREQFLQKKIDAELARAKDCSKRKDKRGALMALKKKKLYEKEQSQLSNT